MATPSSTYQTYSEIHDTNPGREGDVKVLRRLGACSRGFTISPICVRSLVQLGKLSMR